jgi:integrase/recombinase XerD
VPYTRAVRQLAQHYHRRPDQLGDQELRQYFLYLTNQRKQARPTVTIALCGLKFCYEQTLKQPWPTLRFVRPPREHKLPVVLSRKEVRHILSLVRLPGYRVCLTTIYAGGLRLQEGTHLQVADVDSARMLLHIHGKRKGLATYLAAVNLITPTRTLAIIQSSLDGVPACG